MALVAVICIILTRPIINYWLTVLLKPVILLPTLFMIQSDLPGLGRFLRPVAGIGRTLAALKMTKMEHYVDWISTGGGAMLTYLSGAKMPGLKGIVK